jgi:arylamine N-acetyltransferase
MAVEQFDIRAWLSRIGYDGSRDPTLEKLLWHPLTRQPYPALGK